MPPPSSLDMLTAMVLLVIFTGPAPAEGLVLSVGNSPAIMIPPPSSMAWLSITLLWSMLLEPVWNAVLRGVISNEKVRLTVPPE
jgi:hypothetical protein